MPVACWGFFHRKRWEGVAEKAESALQKAQSDFDRLQEKFERAQNDTRRVSASERPSIDFRLHQIGFCMRSLP